MLNFYKLLELGLHIVLTDKHIMKIILLHQNVIDRICCEIRGKQKNMNTYYELFRLDYLYVI